MAEKPPISNQFTGRRTLTTDELLRIDPIAVCFEGTEATEAGLQQFIFSICGRLDGTELGVGCTVLGDLILVHADDYGHAARAAVDGLIQTLVALKAGQGSRQVASIPTFRTASERTAPARLSSPLQLVPRAPRPGDRN